MTKKNETYAYSIILNSNKKEQTTDKSYNMQEHQKHYAKCKKPDLINDICHDRQICRDKVFPSAVVWKQASLQMGTRNLLGVIDMF